VQPGATAIVLALGSSYRTIEALEERVPVLHSVA
jgi:hypothetical protein